MQTLLTNEQRQAIDAEGTPLPFLDEATHSTYILLSAEFVADPHQGITAHIPGISAYGEGETEQEASLALCEALRAYLETFNDR